MVVVVAAAVVDVVVAAAVVDVVVVVVVVVAVFLYLYSVLRSYQTGDASSTEIEEQKQKAAE